MEHGSEEDESSGHDGSVSLVEVSLKTGGFGPHHEAAAVGWDD